MSSLVMASPRPNIPYNKIIVLCILIGLYADPDPAFYLNAGPDPGRPTNADPCVPDPQMTKFNFYMKNIPKVPIGNGSKNISTKEGEPFRKEGSKVHL